MRPVRAWPGAGGWRWGAGPAAAGHAARCPREHTEQTSRRGPGSQCLGMENGHAERKLLPNRPLATAPSRPHRTSRGGDGKVAGGHQLSAITTTTAGNICAYMRLAVVAQRSSQHSCFRMYVHLLPGDGGSQLQQSTAQQQHQQVRAGGGIGMAHSTQYIQWLQPSSHPTSLHASMQHETAKRWCMMQMGRVATLLFPLFGPAGHI